MGSAFVGCNFAGEVGAVVHVMFLGGLAGSADGGEARVWLGVYVLAS